MINYKKNFLFLAFAVLSNSYSHAAYQNPSKINDFEYLKKAESMGQELVDRQNNFWNELKYFFKWDKFCQHKIRGYLSIIEFLFDRVQGRSFNKEGMSYGWNDTDAVVKTFEKHFPQDQDFHAFILLRDMICVDGELFKNLENINFHFQNGFRLFWGPVQFIFNKRQDIHRLYSFCEIIIFLKNLDILYQKSTESFFKNDKIDNEKEIFVKFVGGKFKDIVYEGEYKNCLLLSDLKNFWGRAEFGCSWSYVVYKIIENFCLNSQRFRELEK